MLEVIKDTLNRWNVTKSERQKLQHSYLALTMVIVLIAGIFSLFNATLGHNVVLIAVIALAIFFVNALIWNLLQSTVLDKLATKSKRK